MIDNKIYLKSFKYENLVRVAFNCSRGIRHGADLCFMQNAMTMEEGKTYAKHLGSFEKQFEKVKLYTSKALLKLAKTKPYASEKEFFLSLEANIKHTNSTSELMQIVDLGMDKVLKLKN